MKIKTNTNLLHRQLCPTDQKRSRPLNIAIFSNVYVFCLRLINVSDPFILQLFHTWLSSWFCNSRPGGSNVTLELLGSWTWHSALWPLRLEITLAIMSGHWPRLNQRNNRALVYVRVCYADNYDQPVNKWSGVQRWFVFVYVSVRESVCVYFCMREPVFLIPEVKVL